MLFSAYKVSGNLRQSTNEKQVVEMLRDTRLTSTEGKQNAISERTRERRLSLGLTQSGLAGRLSLVTQGLWNCSESEIAKIEGGSRRVIDLELRAMTKALECSAAYLWGDEDVQLSNKPQKTTYSPTQPRRRVPKEQAANADDRLNVP